MKSAKRLVILLLVVCLLLGVWVAMRDNPLFRNAPTGDVTVLEVLPSSSAAVTETVPASSQAASSAAESEAEPASSQPASSQAASSQAASSQATSSQAASSQAASSQAASSAASQATASSKPASSQATASHAPAKPSKPAKETNQTKIVNYVTRPTYASVQSEIAALAEAYPDLIRVSSIGTSVQGRDLTMLTLGNGRAEACIIAGIHAREGVSVSFLMRCIEEYAAAYVSESGKMGGYNMKNLLDVYTLYIVPLSNPDGLEIVGGRAEPEVRVAYEKDQDISDYKGNANGVNLNKNFPLLWDKINTKCNKPHAEKYKGPAAASEPETQALMALCEAHDFMWMTSIHVRGDCVYWSDKTNPSVGQSAVMAQKLKERLDFYKCPTSEKVEGYGGGFENWFRQQYDRPGLCLELMPLDYFVTPLSDETHSIFSTATRWDLTKKAIPLLMYFGFIY